MILLTFLSINWDMIFFLFSKFLFMSSGDSIYCPRIRIMEQERVPWDHIRRILYFIYIIRCVFGQKLWCNELNKIEIFRNQSWGDVFHVKNSSHKVKNELKIYVHFFSNIFMKIKIMKILIFSYKNSSVDFIDVLAVFTVTPERGINFHF